MGSPCQPRPNVNIAVEVAVVAGPKAVGAMAAGLSAAELVAAGLPKVGISVGPRAVRPGLPDADSRGVRAAGTDGKAASNSAVGCVPGLWSDETALRDGGLGRDGKPGAVAAGVGRPG